MQYQGGKARLAKHYAPILQAALASGRPWVEPFVGGFNVVPGIGGAIGACYDREMSLISFWDAVKRGWLPYRIDEAGYHRLKEADDQENPMTAFAAFGCSWGGKKWGGWARGAPGRDYVGGTLNGIRKKAPFTKTVTFTWAPYAELAPENAVVYCDPPYAGTTPYNGAEFDHTEFWRWCDACVERGCAVFVSEFAAPEHWTPAWQATRYLDTRRATGETHVVEKLFTRR